ncbi:pyruvate formate-lyase-activating protein [Proteinivorax hydrogeniformans]|uniref:Pyruvate formate-lyase-activating enzyme n=1 Tax=Proteinivorax hydrogeniformans TaxID=1826727 RepID=A0AAU8HTC8_9FIRM
MTTANVHSIETMGLVDGPGVRTVIFLQGCQLRCIYCHNPDTWKAGYGKEMSVDELIKMVKRYKFYYKDNGGITVSGGDPLLQPQFLKEFLKACKEEGINTAIDTSGHGLGDYDDILKYTDLVLLDIKAANEDKYREITKRKSDKFFEFLEAVKRNNVDIWTRHVVVPTINAEEKQIVEVAKFINTIPNVKKVELLPYHNQGAQKYKSLDMKYPLEGVQPLDNDSLDYFNKVLHKHLDIIEEEYSKTG